MTKPIKPPPSNYKTYWCTTGVHGAKGHGGYCPVVIKWLLKTWTCTCDCHTEADIDQRHEELLNEELGPSVKAATKIFVDDSWETQPDLLTQVTSRIREVLQAHLAAP